MLNAKAYVQQYAYEKFKEAEDFDDLISALADEVLLVEEQYRLHQYHRVKKVFDPSDTETRTYHDTAKPIEIGLDGVIAQFLTLVVTPENARLVEEIYGQEKRGKKVPDTPLNRLDKKLTNTKKIIKRFRDDNRLILRRRYYFQDNKLFISPGRPVKFTEDKLPHFILSELFKKPHSKVMLLKKYKQSKNIQAEWDNSADEKIEQAVVYINNRVRSNTGESPSLIKTDGNKYWLNTSLFHILDRIK